MRDPLLYRIKHAAHYRHGDTWCIYPMYDYAHPLEDAIEEVTHSLCTLEFDANREVYDWVLDSLYEEPRPHQYEFARLNLDFTVMSKRKLAQLVQEGHVEGWDDPRMPTLAGMRRRGVTPEAIRSFCEHVGVTKVDSRVDIGLLEYSIRDDLNYRAPRVMAGRSQHRGYGDKVKAPCAPAGSSRAGSWPTPAAGAYRSTSGP